MEFKQAVQVCLREKYANFTGRASRSEFWWFVLALFIVEVVLLVLAAVFGKLAGILALLFVTVYYLVALGCLVPLWAVGARRLHDTGKSGWLQLLQIIPLIGIIILIVFWVLPTTPGSNAYGEPPAT
jgi:uncharacterized membrane protein YhaH (DUF805 family)